MSEMQYRNVKRIILICKKELKGFYNEVGFRLVGRSRVVYGKDQWYEMNIDI